MKNGVWQFTKVFSKRGRLSLLGPMAGFAASSLIKRERQKWVAMDAVLENINAYNLGRGAGELLSGWLTKGYPTDTADQHAERLHQLMQTMDAQDTTEANQARNRFLASKIMFDIEGFKLTHCHYEDFQQEAWRLLRSLPQGKKLSRKDIFLGKPFAPEQVIGTTHEILSLLSDDQAQALKVYLNQCIGNSPRQSTDFFAQLIARTYEVSEADQLQETLSDWFEAYRAFEIKKTDQKEQMVTQSIEGIGAMVAGGIPALAGQEILGRLYQGLVKK